jgi:hypothetical protein
MQTPPSTPAPTVAPGAPIRPRFIAKRSKSTPALSAEDKAALLPKLKAIRAKHAPRVLELTALALEAIHALEVIEDTMDNEARALYPHYVRDIHDYKLTFQLEYPERAEELDEDLPLLEHALQAVGTMEAEAEGEPVSRMP